MSTRARPDVACAREQDRRYGLIGRAEALALGMSPGAIGRLVRAGKWVAVYPGVYRLLGAPQSWEGHLLAACIYAGPGAAVSHRAAAALVGLDGFPRGVIELTVTRQLRHRMPAAIHRVTHLDPASVTAVAGIPVTRVERTLFDLASVSTPARLERALEDALRRRLTTHLDLAETLAERARSGRNGTVAFRRLLESRQPIGPAAHSAFERNLEDLLIAGGLPRPVRQHRVMDGDGLAGQVDLGYPTARLALEADSFRWHGGRAPWQRDLMRRNALLQAGWRVLHFTPEDVRGRPSYVVDQVRRALDRQF